MTQKFLLRTFFIACITLFVCGCTIFQKNSAHSKPNPAEGTLDSDSTSTYAPPFFTLNSNKPFFQFGYPVYDFEFKMYDRWGVKMAESRDPQFVIDHALLIKPDSLKVGPYFYQVKFRKVPEGEMITITGSKNYYAP